VLDAVSIRYPFLTLEQAAFFLQVPVTTAEWVYEAGELPKALRLDGGIFEPVPGKRLIPYEEFAPLLDESAARRLDDWELGRIEVPSPASSGSPAPPAPAVIYKDNDHDDR
jgi:hypothetical protein